MERIELDAGHFLHLSSKGSLFSQALTPVCTAADPGFRGYLGITMTNLSSRSIQLSEGTGFVKGSFFQLPENVEKTYTGQHGDATMSWPFPTQFQTEPVDYGSWNAQHWRFLPPPVIASLDRIVALEAYTKWAIPLLAVLLVINATSLLFPLQTIFPDSYTQVQNVMNLTGVLASIAGLAIAIALPKQKRTNVRD
jgi:hypothetical protein